MLSPTQGHIQTLSLIPAAFQVAPCPTGSPSTSTLHSRPFIGPRVALFPLSA